MNSRWRGSAATFAACVSLLACGQIEQVAGTSPEGGGESVKQPLLSVPPPIDSEKKPTWAGSSNDLLLADAMASCMLPTNPTGTDVAPGRVFGSHIRDRVFDRIQALMDKTLANSNYSALEEDGRRMGWWLRLRNDPSKNALPLSIKPQSMGLVGAFPNRYVIPSTGSEDLEALREALEVAGVNFCLARTLKEQAGLDSVFLMTKVEQRELFQTIRERNQIAMLQLSNLFRALALQDKASIMTMDPAVRAAYLGPRKGWFSEDLFSEYAKDLSDLILWEIEITEKLSSLLMRSASAHDPLPGQSSLPRDGLDAGSWRQRVLALLYGGDPLAAGDPGARPLSKDALPDDEAASSMLRWPNAAEVPVSAPNLWTPQAIRFRAYLERFDTFSLVLKSDAAYQSPSDIDVTQSAIWLYRELEAKLRQRACPPSAPEVVPSGKEWCRALDPAAIAERIDLSASVAPSTNLLTYKMHGLKPSDALQLVTAVVDIMPSLSGSNGFFVEGAVQQTRLSGRLNPALVFSKPRFAPRSVLELAAVLGSRGRHLIPDLVDASDASASAVRVVSPLLSGRATAAGAPLDEVAALGTVPALAAAREALAGSLLRQYLGGAPDPADLINAAIGRQQVSIRPVERVAYAGGTTNVLQVRDAAEKPLWKISVTPDPADPFWSGTPGQYVIYAAVDYPAILHRLADPATEKLGLRTLDDLTTRGLDSRLLLIRPQKPGDVFSGSVYLPPKKPVVFFARRAQVEAGVSRYTYMPLTGSVRLWADWRPGIKSMGVPLDSQYYAVGGSMSRIAVNAIAVMPWDFSEPAVDGFGEPRGFVPAFQTNSAAGQESLLAYRDQMMKLAEEAANEAQGAVKTVLGHFREGLLEEINVEVERNRELNTTNQILTSACGSSSVDASDESNPCNVEFKTFSALGNTADELEAICGVAAGDVEPITFDWKYPDDCELASSDTDDPPPRETRARCLMAQITQQTGASVELAKRVGCSQYLDPLDPNVTYGKGSVPAALLRQQQALAAYRSSVKGLRAEGQALISAAAELDSKIRIADQEAQTLREEQSHAMRAAFRHLGELNDAFNQAETRYTKACTYLAELTDTSIKTLMKETERFDWRELLMIGGKGALGGGANSWASEATKKAAASITTGAALGSALWPGVGTLIGAAAGGLVAIGTALLGPSEEELTRATNDADIAKEERDNAKDAVVEEIKLIGQCPEDLKRDYPEVCTCTPEGTCTAESGTLTALQALKSQLETFVTLDARLSASAAYDAGVTRIQERISAVEQAAFELAKTNLSIKNDMLDVGLAVQKARFEFEQVKHRNSERFAVNQIFYANDISVANGLMEGARSSVLHARQAVEYTMLLKLSNVGNGNALVGPPSQWADQLYDTDLSELRIVGKSQDPTYPDVLSDAKLVHFVSNLESFVEGYPGSGKIITVQNGAGGAFVLSAPSPDSEVSGGTSWFLECPANSTCAPEGGWCPARSSLANVCLSTMKVPLLPRRLKVAFSLNSGGGLGLAAADPYVNSRWYRSVVTHGVANVISDIDGKLSHTSLKKCHLASTPELRSKCNSNYSGELKFSLQHEAPFVVLDADGRWQALSLEDGYRASKLTVPMTQFPDPLLPGNSLDPTGPLKNYVNYQSKGFPLEGWYELTLEARTDDGTPVSRLTDGVGSQPQIITDLTALPWIKVLFDWTYWDVQ